MPRRAVTAAAVLASIGGWRGHLQEVFDLTDPDAIRRELLHIDASMDQLAHALEKLCVPDDPL